MLPCSLQVNFRWAVNTSKGLSDFDLSRYTSEGSTSTLNYRPYSYQMSHSQDKNNNNNNNMKDNEVAEDKLSAATESFGVVFCWAHNKIGWQKEPCIFTVRPAGMFHVAKYSLYMIR